MSNNHIKSKYLEQLKFDKNLENSWFNFFLERTRLLILIVAVIFIAGYMSLKSLPLESTPEVQIGIAGVITVMPGASPEMMEDLVTKKLEKEIGKVKGIDTMTSSSKNSMSSITVQFKSTVDIPTAIRDLKDKVDSAKKDLPTDAKDPVVKEFSMDDTPVWTFAISGDYDGFQLYEYAKKIKEEIEKNPSVSEVTVSGGDEVEYSVELDPKKLDEMGITVSSINTALQALNFTIPVGELDVDKYTHTVTIDERFFTLENLKNLVISKTGTTGVIYLKDIANITESAKKRTTLSRLSSKGSEPENAVTLSVVKKRGGSIVDLVEQGQVALKNMRDKGIIPGEKELTFITILDTSERIKLDLHSLIRDGSLTVLLVFTTLFLIIGIKEALVAGLSAPLVLFMTFTIMALAGQTLNFLSMFALILSLGLLVDDAIVVISAINQYKGTGKFTTKEAALLVLRDYKNVLISTTLTVVWIFSAMLFMTGIMGKFIFSIPFIITTTLLSSLFVALTINPALAVTFDRIGENRKKGKFVQFLEKGFLKLDKIENLYERFLEYILARRIRARTFAIFILLLFISALALPVTGILKSDFFPKTDQDLFYINFEAEPGTRLDVTSELVKQVETRLLQEKEINNFSTVIGSQTAGAKQLTGGSSGNNYAGITINLIKKEYGRKETSLSMAERLRNEFSKIKDIKVTVDELSGGPPSGADFEVKITGDDFGVMEKIANDYKKVLATIPGTINIQTSRKPVPLEFKFSFDSKKLALYNLTLPQVGVFVRNAIDGTEATKILKGTDEIVVRTIYTTGS
ncbi:MAG: efflux RND transporter permease subunit, partial [Candidatus Gracilibacteria bacterium]|nr:efflux RND transporter permease subunit [Candidatus Gracilibacteria bacterium]